MDRLKKFQQIRNQTYDKLHPSDKFVTTQALSGITKIKPFFHRMILSSRLNYHSLEDCFPGAIRQPNNSTEIAKSHTGGFYKNAGWLWLPLTEKKLTIYYNPTKGFFPASRISITDPSIENLIELETTTSKDYLRSVLQFASIEYTIDFYCNSPTDVGNLYYVLRRHYYCPHAKRTVLLGGEFSGYSPEQDYSLQRDTNSVFLINFSQKPSSRPSKKIKFYERGDDSKKMSHEKFWQHDVCDRVRFEVTFTTKLLREQNISCVYNFLVNPKFFKLIFPSDRIRPQLLFQFKRFQNRNYRKYVPPSCNEVYYHSDAEKHSFECFIEETLYAKNQDLDLSNCLENYAGLDGLVTRTKKAVIGFETSWKKKIKMLREYGAM
jgi:hypothetical protein